jgi:hypothetical protein
MTISVLFGRWGLALWTIINLACAAAYVHYSALGWLPRTGDAVSEAGNGVSLFWTTVPLFLGMMVYNLLWALLATRARMKHALPLPLPTGVVIVAVWMLALRVDAAGFPDMDVLNTYCDSVVASQAVR